VEPHLAAHAAAFLDQRQNVGSVLAERGRDPVDIAGELFVADQRWPERAAEGEIGMEDRRDQAFVDVIPQFLLEHAHHFFLR
jgi:hypothetical protein